MKSQVALITLKGLLGVNFPSHFLYSAVVPPLQSLWKMSCSVRGDEACVTSL